MACRGICERYRSEKSRYEGGAKRCSHCDVYMHSESVHCPCCGTQLRTRRKARQRS